MTVHADDWVDWHPLSAIGEAASPGETRGREAASPRGGTDSQRRPGPKLQIAGSNPMTTCSYSLLAPRHWGRGIGVAWRWYFQATCRTPNIIRGARLVQ